MEQVPNYPVNSLITKDRLTLNSAIRHDTSTERFPIQHHIGSNLVIFLGFNRVPWDGPDYPYNSSSSAFPPTLDGFDTRDLNLIRNVSLKSDISIEIRIIRHIKSQKLSQPLILTVSHEDNLVFIEEEILNIWSEGDTYEEALENFEDFFLYDFESYKNMPKKKMDVYAREVLKLYRALLK